MIAKEYAFNLKKASGGGRPKKFLIVNCASVKNLGEMMNDVIIPCLDKDVTILLDEASELPMPASMALLSMLNPNKENKNQFAYGDYNINIDFSKQTFLFATTEAHKMFHALMDRLTRVDLEDYSLTELGEIVNKGLNGTKFEDGILEKISSVLRGNARQARKMADDISSYLKRTNQNNFSTEDWKEFIKALDIHPLGLNQTELRVLRVLSERKETKLTTLAAMMGMSRSSVQRDAELYLQCHNLMSVGLTGRAITAKGQAYLRGLTEVA